MYVCMYICVAIRYATTKEFDSSTTVQRTRDGRGGGVDDLDAGCRAFLRRFQETRYRSFAPFSPQFATRLFVLPITVPDLTYARNATPLCRQISVLKMFSGLIGVLDSSLADRSTRFVLKRREIYITLRLETRAVVTE